jgi:signal transduction histidine kinase
MVKRWPLGRALARLGVGLVMLGLMPGVLAAAQQKQVLLLYSTRRDAQIAVVGDRELPRILDAGLTEGLDFYSEYLDLARFPDPEYRSAFRDFLRTKYKGQRFDVVIAMDDTAFEFIDRRRSELFRDVPVVFFASSPTTRRIANSTGVIAELNLSATVALAAELQPDLRQVFVVSGAETADRMFERQARAQLRSFEPRLRITYLSGLPTRELESRLTTLPEHSIVFFLLVTRDGAGENFHPLDYVDRVTAAANAPTYCWVDSAMNHGIVGGSLKDQAAEVAEVARIALRVLNGEPADSIPLSSPDLSSRQVDWRQIRRWGISEARIPSRTLIRFRERGLWEQNKVYIIGAAALLLAQSALIAGLVVQLTARRRAEARLRATELGLRMSRAQLLDSVENERSRISRELHDDVGQRLAAMTMTLDDLGTRLPVPALELHMQIETLSNQSRQLAKDVQTISRNLHVSKLDYLGLVLACEAFCRELSVRPQLAVAFNARDIPEYVEKEVSLCVYRVLQESVNNAVKHAGARHIGVALWEGNDEIRLVVVDDGLGFDPAAARKGPGMGLISMEERLRVVAGKLSIESRPGAGATIRARVPLTRSGGPSAGASR